MKKQVSDVNDIGTACQVTDFGLRLIRDDRENILITFVCIMSNINMEAIVFVFFYSFLRLCLCSNVKMPKYPYQPYKEYSSNRVMFYLLSFFFL